MASSKHMATEKFLNFTIYQNYTLALIFKYKYKALLLLYHSFKSEKIEAVHDILISIGMLCLLQSIQNYIKYLRTYIK